MASLASPTAPRFDHRTDPSPTLGFGNGTPRLTWTVTSAPDDYDQSGYDIEVSRETGATVFTVESAEQVLVPWPAEPLQSRERASVRVRVRGAAYESVWSPASIVETGLLAPDDWTATFISPRGIGGLHQAAPELHGSIDIAGEIASARLYATSHGILSALVNGVPADDTVLAPGCMTSRRW
jgi:alpha-L-rhamnosidase